jgi:hypothetical protein
MKKEILTILWSKVNSREIQNKINHKQDDIIFLAIQQLLESENMILNNNKYTVK